MHFVLRVATALRDKPKPPKGGCVACLAFVSQYLVRLYVALGDHPRPHMVHDPWNVPGRDQRAAQSANGAQLCTWPAGRKLSRCQSMNLADP